MTLPSSQVFGSWESMWRYLFTPYSFRYAHRKWWYSFVSFLDPLMSLHNFTFDLVKTEHVIHPEEHLSSNRAFIMMSTSLVFNHPIHKIYMAPISLYEFEEHRVFYFTKPARSNPTTLSSLRAPFSDPAATRTLLSLSCCMAVILWLLRGKLRDVAEALIITLSGFVGKDCARGAMLSFGFGTRRGCSLSALFQ